MCAVESKIVREFTCTVPYDKDLLLGLKELATRLKISTGTLTVIGALRNATLYYYLQDEKKFKRLCFANPMEIVSGIGNIATLNNELIIHCHLVLANKNGTCYGGHLTEGSRVFAAEVQLRELSPPIGRQFDQTTGLNLLKT